MMLNNALSENSIRNNLIFYDCRSIEQIYFLFSGVRVHIFPENISISLGFSEEQHKNLRGQTTGILRSFKGGTLSLNVASNSFFRSDFRDRFEAPVDIFVLIKDKNLVERYYDKFTCSLTNFEISTSEPFLNCKMDFSVHSVFREDISRGIPSKSLFKLNSVYYTELISDDTALDIVYSDKTINQDVSITLKHITSFKGTVNRRNEQKRMDKQGTWLWLQDGVEPMTLAVTARLYDIIDYQDGTILKDGAKLALKDNEVPKEEILKNLIKLLNNEVSYKEQGKLPYEVYLKSTLITEITPYSYTFILNKIEYDMKDNYIEVNLSFIERREEQPDYKPYIPKNKNFLNKAEDLYTIPSVRYSLSKEFLNRAKKWLPTW